MIRLKHINEIASWGQCLGCGACAFICPKGKVKLVDVHHAGIRPVVTTNSCNSCRECLEVCPGHSITQQIVTDVKHHILELVKGWGHVLELWEGYAADSVIRFSGSSGGLVTALATFCLEKQGDSCLTGKA